MISSGDNGEGSEDFAKKVSGLMQSFARAALADPQKTEADLNFLDRILSYRADELYKDVLGRSGAMYNNMLRLMPDERSKALNAALVGIGFNPVITHSIGMNTEYTDFYASQIVELPGYIKLHEAAQRVGVAVNVTGLTGDEKRGPGGAQPKLVIDVLKSYAEGEMETTYGYPTLPEQTAAPQQKQSGMPVPKFYRV